VFHLPSFRQIASTCALLTLLAAHLAAADCVDYTRFPVVTGTLPIPATQLEPLAADYLVAVAGHELVVLEVTGPGAPVNIGAVTLGTSQDLTELAVCGTIAYCAFEGSTALYAVDLADMALPIVLGQVNLGDTVRAIGGEGDLLGVLVDGGNWRLYEVLDPLFPQLLYQEPFGFAWSEIRISPGRAMLLGNGWKLYELSPSSAPVLVAEQEFAYYSSTWEAYGTAVNGCEFHGDELVQYLDQWHRYGDWIHGVRFSHWLTLRTLDISDPDNPVVTDEVELGSSSGIPGLMHDHFALAGDLAFAQQGDLRIYDLSDGLDQVAAIPGAGIADALAVVDGRLYAADGSRVACFSLGDLTLGNLLPLGLPGMDPESTTTEVVRGLDWVATVSGWDTEGFAGNAIDIYDPAVSFTEPVSTLGGNDIGIGSLTARPHTLFTIWQVGWNQNLAWFDLTDPAAPGGPFIVPFGEVLAYALGPNNVVAMTDVDNLRLYDITNPWAPVLESTVGNVNSGYLLWHKNLLFARTPTGLQVLDVSDPSAPFFETPIPIGQMDWLRTLDDQHILAGTGSTIHRIDVSDPDVPVVEATSIAVTGIRNLERVGDVLYVSSGGVEALDATSLAPIGILAPVPAIGPLLNVGGELLGFRLHGQGGAVLPTHCSATSVDDADGAPAALALRLGVQPNPFNPRTEIRYTATAAQHLALVVYDLRGRAVRRLVDENMDAGEHLIEWNGRDDADRALPSGTYLLRLSAGRNVTSTKVTLIE
jgi:hypothetical protein